MPDLITSDLGRTFQAIRSGDPLRLERQSINQPNSSSQTTDYRRISRQQYSPVTSVNTGAWGNGEAGMHRFAGSGGIVYGQPQFFSPVHTPINWQIPSKTLEQRQWCRFFLDNEPKVAAAINFYSNFPMSNWEHECKNRKVKVYFDQFKKKHHLPKWCRLISHELHLLGDCFPFTEISCPICGGSGKIGTDICEHEGGTLRRVVILNPDSVEVYTSPMNPEAVIALRPDEELINVIQRRTPGYEKFTAEVRKLISSGQPIRLSNSSVSHLKYGECGYQKYGTGMVRCLFPILSYKTKLMVAQWIVAERLIVPIKVVKVGSDERPAGPADIAAVQAMLANTANDPNMTIVTHHAFDLDWIGASGKILTLSNEFELINQEILDGMMINNALLNGEGPTFASASVGIEAMIQRLTTFREQITEWLEDAIYRPEAIRQGFFEEDPDTGEQVPLIPNIKWNSMHLRDQQQYRTFLMQLYEKGVLSCQSLLEAFDIDPDQEIERKRYDALQMVALGQGQQGGGAGGGGGGMGGLPPPMGGGGAGGEPPISAPGDMGGGAPAEGGAPAGGGAPPISKSSSLTAEIASPDQFGGRVLKKNTREKLLTDQRKQKQLAEQEQRRQQSQQNSGKSGEQRDEKGRIMWTKCERDLIPHLIQAKKDGLLGNYVIQDHFRIIVDDRENVIDFAFPQLKIGIEADGEIFHSAPKQKAHDDERDAKLTKMGWAILRFGETEIERNPQACMQQIIKTVMQKQLALKNLEAGQVEQPSPPIQPQ